MNPFNLDGPHFLLFYLLLLAVSGLVRYLFWHSLAVPQAKRRPMTDPYQIAFLRGGPNESVVVATLTLIHRGALKVQGRNVQRVSEGEVEASSQLERAILEECGTGKTLAQLNGGYPATVAENLFQEALERENLIASPAQRARERIVKSVVVVGLVLVAAIKLQLAFVRGRGNIAALCILAFFGAREHLRRHVWRTPNGATVLRDLRVLMGRLRGRLHLMKGEEHNKNFAFFVGLFGSRALSSEEFGFGDVLKPEQKLGSSGCGSSCGSSCSSSSSSCGGGCGGGCGGCGS